MDNAFKYVHENKGLDDETTYPYVGKVRRSMKITESHSDWLGRGVVQVPSKIGRDDLRWFRGYSSRK